ncbi:G2/M phase-specific E3 ubiquitin-protein ligase-like [Dreissena polymorpha]|uniref:G2/M phase-specific E3 ubiquitin-protein ligase-like n=1 Tax=Dreissena polymorpha TaxID=45954 RepID=UPI0022643725|nr:G2/M phase-specific E3 ubiquitin-protein ligase-like [Dreissena polymorpha]
MASHPEVCLPLLSRAPEPLTRTTLRDLFEPVYSVAGSNNRAQEEETVYAWEAFLQDIEDKEVPVSFEDLLVFVTGAEKIPPCGFATKLYIEFYSNEVG